MATYWILVLGILFSMAGTLSGMGGGVFLFPLLVLAFHVPAEIAVGVTAMSIFPAAVYSSVLNWRRDLIDFRLLFWIEGPAMVGAALGAYLVQFLPQKPLLIGFSVLLILLALRALSPIQSRSLWSRMFTRISQIPPIVATGNSTRLGLWSALVFGGSAGLSAGVLGVGGGIIKTPLLIQGLNVPPRKATATVLAMIALTTLVAGLGHYRLGHFDSSIFRFSATGLLLGAVIAQILAPKISDKAVRKIVAAVMVLAALALMLKVFGN